MTSPTNAATLKTDAVPVPKANTVEASTFFINSFSIFSPLFFFFIRVLYDASLGVYYGSPERVNVKGLLKKLVYNETGAWSKNSK
jgi:hypothetical protein